MRLNGQSAERPGLEKAGESVIAAEHFVPATGSETEWNAAYYRLEDYLRALRVVNKMHQSGIIWRCLEAAAEKHAMDSTQSPTTLAMREARALLEQWFANISPRNESGMAGGLMSFIANDAPEKWPAYFLADEIPADFQNAMAAGRVLVRPDLKVSSMVPQPIEYIPTTAAILPPNLRTRMAEAITLIGLTTLAFSKSVLDLFRR